MFLKMQLRKKKNRGSNNFGCLSVWILVCITNLPILCRKPFLFLFTPYLPWRTIQLG